MISVNSKPCLRQLPSFDMSKLGEAKDQRQGITLQLSTMVGLKPLKHHIIQHDDNFLEHI